MEMATQEGTLRVPILPAEADDVMRWIRGIRSRAQRLVVCYLTALFEMHDHGGHLLGGNGNGNGNTILKELRELGFDIEQDEFLEAIAMLNYPERRMALLCALHGIKCEFGFVYGAPFVS